MAVKKKTTSLKALHEAQLYAQQQRDAAAIAFVLFAIIAVCSFIAFRLMNKKED